MLGLLSKNDHLITTSYEHPAVLKTANELELILKRYMENNGYGFGKVMKPVRLGLCGNLQGPSLFDIMEILGNEVVLKRLNYIIKEI